MKERKSKQKQIKRQNGDAILPNNLITYLSAIRMQMAYCPNVRV